MVEGAPLLREYTRDGIEGSNPFLSAISDMYRQVFRQLNPLIAGRRHIEYRIHDLAQIGRARTSEPLGDGMNGAINAHSPSVRSLAWRGVLRRAVSVQGICGPLRFGDRTESQTTETAQLFSRLALSSKRSSRESLLGGDRRDVLGCLFERWMSVVCSKRWSVDPLRNGPFSRCAFGLPLALSA